MSCLTDTVLGSSRRELVGFFYSSLSLDPGSQPVTGWFPHHVWSQHISVFPGESNWQMVAIGFRPSPVAADTRALWGYTLLWRNMHKSLKEANISNCSGPNFRAKYKSCHAYSFESWPVGYSSNCGWNKLQEVARVKKPSNFATSGMVISGRSVPSEEESCRLWVSSSKPWTGMLTHSEFLRSEPASG